MNLQKIHNQTTGKVKAGLIFSTCYTAKLGTWHFSLVHQTYIIKNTP